MVLIILIRRSVTAKYLMLEHMQLERDSAGDYLSQYQRNLLLSGFRVYSYGLAD